MTSNVEKFIIAVGALAASYGIILNRSVIISAIETTANNIDSAVDDVIESAEKIKDAVVNTADKWDGNPLNIRGSMSDSTEWLGEKTSDRNAKNYMGFIHEKYSFRAGFKLLVNYKAWYSLESIIDIITRYAPAEDNNHTENYANYVAGKMGVSTNYKVPQYRYAEMLAYMSDFETGEHGARPTGLVEGYLREFNLI